MQASETYSSILSTLGMAALDLAAAGWKVFPLVPRGKGPLIPKADGGHGCLDATRDPEQIAAWWRQEPRANIGLACGDGGLIVDVDGPQGAAWVESMELPETLTVRTANGEHRYYSIPEGVHVGNATEGISNPPQIHLRGAGGYVVAPPSVHPSGALYQWLDVDEAAPSRALMRPLPGWMLAALTKPAASASNPGERFALPASIPEGGAEGTPGRNETLYRFACSLRAREIDPAEIRAEVARVNAERCKPPLGAAEVSKLIQSALTKPAGPSTRHAEVSSRLSVEMADGPFADPNERWPDPAPLPDQLPHVDALDPELLPGPLRAMAEGLARSMDCPIELPAVALMCTLAGSINRRALITPKQYGEWTVVPNLWGLMVAPAGFKKSPIGAACTKPLMRLEAERGEQRAEENKALAAAMGEYEIRLQAWTDKAKAAAKKGDPLPDGKPQPPTGSPEGTRLIVMDTTAEKLHDLLSKHPAGLLTVRDEVGAFMAELSKKGRESDRGFYLTAWAGDQPYSIDRIGRGEINVPNCCLSFIGGIQPAILQGLMATATAAGGGDGLMARFQMALWPDFKKDFEYRDELADRPTAYAFENLLREMVTLDHTDPLRLRFNGEAQELFREFLTDIETRARNEENPAFGSHLSKYASLMPTLAALIHLGEGFRYEVVSLDSAQRAAAWCQTLESHAKRIYGAALRPEMAAAIALGKRIQKGELVEGGVVSARSIYRRHLADLNTPELVKAAMESLETLDWVRAVQPPKNTTGRPALRWAVNPALLR